MSDRPKEGIYLDAALAVIGEQIEERIDELSRRRRTRLRAGIAALCLTSLAGGSVAAAVALSASPTTPPAAAAPSVVHEVRCVEGESASRDAYFAVRYAAPAGTAADEAGVCARAWSALATDGDELHDATPDELIAIAAGLVTAAASGDAAAEAPAVASATVVSDASFGTLRSHIAAPSFTACDRGDRTLVLALRDPAPTATERVLLCAKAGR